MSIVEKLRKGITTSSARETRSIAAGLADGLPADCTLALHGDMGAGKTTFVQGLARGFGVTGQVTSPTFAIYTVHPGSGRTLVHLDAYRLEREEDVEALLLDEFLRSPYCLAVEWPGRIAGWLPPDAWHLSLSIVDANRHRLQLR